MRPGLRVGLVGGLLFVGGLTACERSLVSVDSDFPDVAELLPESVRDVLEDPDDLTIFALHPYPHTPEGRPGNPEEDFHEFRILGEAELEEERDLTALVRFVYRGLIESDGMVAACFDPRHGIRASQGGDTVDLLICFECLQLEIYENGERIADALTSDSVEPSVSALYAKAGLRVHR